jgi:FkbH-like protein
MAAKFANYGEYLDSLEMQAEIDGFQPVYLDRITQLTNKTNQFNLTTRRYTFAEIEAASRDRRYITLYGKLTDIFGDNGLISVIIGRVEDANVHIDLWLMSCRVLKRDMELAMLDGLAERARAGGAERLVGYYYRTPKNAMVEDHYARLGFSRESAAEDGSMSVWTLPVGAYSTRNTHIRTATSVIYG